MSDEILKQILGSLNELKSEQQSTNKRLDRLDERFNQMDSRFDGMDSRFERMDGQLERLETEQQTIKQAVLETNKTVLRVESEQQSIKQVVEQQHRIIEVLSARSIDHEAVLKRIK